VNTDLFPPNKRNGLIFHGIVLAVFLAISAFGFINIARTDVGPNFVLFLLVGLIAFAPVPIFGYRAYALVRAEYILDRDSLEIRWGLRDEDIPLSDIEWIRSLNDLTHPLGTPPMSMPGAILGLRRHIDLGVVEFIASDKKNILLVATAKRVYAISPSRPGEFTQTFARATELGSLVPAQAKSVYPSFIVAQAWDNGIVRYLWLATLFLNLGLFVWVGLLIPSLTNVALGVAPDQSVTPVPSVQLIIVPLISTLMALIGWSAGLYFYRRKKQRVLSFIVWASSLLTSLLFLAAVFFIINTPV
jgi:hypothetical protein